MHRIGGFNHFPTLEGTVGTVIEKCVAGRHEEGKYGVKMDEFKDLVDDEDVFDGSPEGGPCPKINERLDGHVPYVEIPLDIDEKEIKLTKTKKKNIKEVIDVDEAEDTDDNQREDQFSDYVKGIRDGHSSFTVNEAAYNLFRPGYTVILYGPRRSGKSVAVRNIAARMRHYFPEVVVFTMTKASGEYFTWVPYCRVVEGLDEDVLQNLIDHQMSLKKKRSRGIDVGNMNLLIIIDDCMAQGLRYVKTFNQLFYNGRHLDITLFVLVQDVRGIAPSATINADVVCTFSLPDRRGRDTIREKFCDYLTRDEFNRLYDHPDINKKHHLVMFDIAHRYNNINQRISFGCVDIDAEVPFVMGSREMWCESAESRQQLEDLGFGYLMEIPDWGIIEPRHVDEKQDARRKAKTKNARKHTDADMPEKQKLSPNKF